MYIYPMVRFCTNNIITVEHLRIGPQGCALAEPSGPWRLTFALGRLENLTSSYKSYAGHPGFHSFRALGSLQFSLEHSVGPPWGERKVAIVERWPLWGGKGVI